MHKPGLLATTLLAGLTVAAVPAQAQSMVGRLLGQTTPQAVLRPDMAAKIRDLLTGRGIPSDVADASLSALATGLVSGTPTGATVRGFAYAWSIAGGPLDSRNCRAVAGGWKRATSPKSELTENGPWCWSAEGWIPVKNQFDGELSPLQAQAPVQRPAPRHAPPVATAATPAVSPTPPAAAAAVTIEDIDKAMMLITNSPLKAWPDMSAPTLGELILGARVRATGIVHGPVAFLRVMDASGRTGYMLGGRLAPAPPLRPSAPDTRSYPVDDMRPPASAPATAAPATAVQAPARPASPTAVVQAPAAPAVAVPAPVQRPVDLTYTHGHPVRELDEIRYATRDDEAHTSTSPTGAILYGFRLGDKVHVTGEVEGGEWLRVVTPRSGAYTGYVLATSVQAVPVAPAPVAQPPAPSVPTPAIVETPPPPAPAVVQAAPPPIQAAVQAAPVPAAPAVAAPAPAPVVAAAPPPVAPPAPPPKPKVKTDL